LTAQIKLTPISNSSHLLTAANTKYELTVSANNSKCDFEITGKIWITENLKRSYYISYLILAVPCTILSILSIIQITEKITEEEAYAQYVALNLT